MKNLTIILILLFGNNLFAEDCIEGSNDAFGDNESLKYKVFYNWKDVWLKAGTVTFEVEDEKLDNISTYHITAIGKTYPFYNMFYKVNDVYETFVEKESVKPRKFLRDVHEGGFKLDHEYNFDRESLRVNTQSVVNTGPKKVNNFDFNTCTQDMLSAIYFMRTIDFKNMNIGDEKPVEVFLDNEFYNLSMIYKGKATVETKFGKISCLKVQPKVISGRVFQDDESVIVYVSDDENKIPVLIESPLSVGVVKAVLDDFGHLKNKMNFID